MAKKWQLALFATCFVLASETYAQRDVNPDHRYPNTTSFGSDVDKSQPWFQQCLRVQALSPPAAPAAPVSCQTFDYYDKLGQASTSAAEWRGVRACAIAAKDNAVLTMLYANGLGVARDLDLATQYACRDGGAPAELMGRVATLQSFKTSAPDKRFDQCDDATSGDMMGRCARIADGQAEKVREAYFVRLRRQLPPSQVGVFDQLLAATRALAKARREETDLSGSGRGAFQVQAEADEKEWLREHLAAFEKGSNVLPPAAQFAIDDAELNLAYQAVMAAPVTGADHHLGYSTITKAQVRTAQRAWLTYRDAWVKFAALRYPAVAPDALKAALTQWRSKQLRRIG